jgi:hypothetical protein
MLAQYQVPFIRAVWCIKVLCLNQFRGKHTDLSQIWTDVVIGFLNEQMDPLNIAFSERDSKYLVRLVNWCIGERLIDLQMLENWFISKCDEIISPSSSSFITSDRLYSPILQKTMKVKSTFDTLLERQSETKATYYQSLNRCAELISQRNVSSY